MEDDGAVEVAERPGDIRVGCAAVDDDRLAELLGDREVRLEELALRIVRRVVAVVVEARLAHGDRIELAKRLELRRALRPPRSCGWMPRIGKTPSVATPKSTTSAPAVGPGADLEDPVDARLPGAVDQLLGRVCARVQVRMRVDHAAAAGASTRGKSGGAGSTSSVSTVLPGATKDQSKSSGWPSACRMRGVVSGRYACKRDGDDADAVGERVEHAVELLGVGVVLGQLPGLRVGDELVQRADGIPDRVDRAGEVEVVEPLLDLLAESVE